MRWKEIMNPLRKDIYSSIRLPMDEDIMDTNLDTLISSDSFVQVVDYHGNCVGSIQRETAEYLHRAQSDNLLTAALDGIGEAVIIIDETGRIYYINPAYTEILGVDAGKLLGRYLQKVEPQSALLTLLNPPHTPRTEKRQLIRTLNKYVSIHVFPVFRKGVFRGAVSVFTDTTRINELNQEVERISQVAQEYSNRLNAENVLQSNHIIGYSKPFLNSINRTITAAKTNVTVLLRGENGTGKEMFARLLLENSPRKDKPFITVNCSAIPETLIESELFGYEEGSFTGAKRGGKLGKFQLAQGGTLFLDEIGDMPLQMQAKLLRVLQEGEIEKIGRQKSIPVDVRIIAATNRPLEEMIQQNHFREDLYYRLNIVSIQIPPLRERENDVLLLANEFLTEYNKKYNKNLQFSREVYQRFQNYTWPGNVRELRNTVESIAVLCPNPVIHLSDLPEQIIQTSRQKPESSSQVKSVSDSIPIGGTLADAVSAYEKQLILDTLAYCKGSREAAIKLLGLSRRTFYRKLSQYNLHDK